MVGVDMRAGADTWSQVDAVSGPAALALGAHQAQHLLDPATHGLTPHVHAEWEGATGQGVVAGSVDWAAVPGGRTGGETEADEVEGNLQATGPTAAVRASVVGRLREEARERALAAGDFAGAAETEALPAEALLRRATHHRHREHGMQDLGMETAILHSLCDASAASAPDPKFSSADCRAAQLYKAALSSLSSPMLRSVSGLTRQRSGWASSDNIVAAIHRTMGTGQSPAATAAADSAAADSAAGALDPGWERALLVEPDTWLSRRLNRSLEVPLDPHAKRIMRRAAGTAGAMLAAVAGHHGSRRAAEVLRSGRLGAAAVLAPVNGSSQPLDPHALAEVLRGIGLHGDHGGLRSHQEVRAVLLQTAAARTPPAKPAVSVAGRVRETRPSPAAAGAGVNGEDVMASIDRAEAHDTLEALTRIGKVGSGGVGTVRTGRHAAALAGMLLETDSAVRGLLRAGVTAREAFACIVDMIMNMAPEILVQIIVNVVRQPFADLMSIIMSLITPPMLAPVPFPKLSFPGPDKGSKPEPKPAKCECTAPPAGGGGGGDGGAGPSVPALPDFESMLPFPVFLEEGGTGSAGSLDGGTGGTSASVFADAMSLWGGVAGEGERERNSAAGGLGASGDSRMARLQQSAAEGGGGVTADVANAQALGVLPGYVWDLSSVPVGGDSGGVDVASATESLRAASRQLHKKQAAESGRDMDRGADDFGADSGQVVGAEEQADLEEAVASDAESSRYTERVGSARASQDASLQAHLKAMALERLNKQTDEAVERAVSLGYSSEEAVGDLMRLASTGARLTGQAEASQMRARASLAARSGASASVDAKQVARLGLRVFGGQQIRNQALGESRCSCPVGALRVVDGEESRFSAAYDSESPGSGWVSVTGQRVQAPASRVASDGNIPTRDSGSMGPAQVPTANGAPADAAWHAAPERQDHSWYPYLHEKPPHMVQRRLDEAGEAMRRRLDRARLESEALAPAAASVTAPRLSKAADENLNRAVHEAARFGQRVLRMTAPHTQDRSSHAPEREDEAASKSEQARSIRLSGHKAPPRRAADVMQQAMRAALGDEEGSGELASHGFGDLGQDITAAESSTIRDPVIDAEASKTTRWIPGEPLAEAPRAARKTQQEFFGVTPRNAAADQDAGIGSEEEEELDKQEAEGKDSVSGPASLLQAAARATARLPGATKGAPISRIVVLVHRLLVSKLLSGALPAAKDRAITGILSSLPGLATRLVVLQAAPRMIPRLATTATSALLRELVPRLLYGITFRTTQRLTRELVPRLSTSLALTIARSVTRDPSLDAECFYCFTKWDAAFRAEARSEQEALKVWLRDRALGRPVSDVPPQAQALPPYCTPCLQSIHQGVALDDYITSRVAAAAGFYTDFYASRGQAGLAAAKAVHTTVTEAREGFAAPEREWDLKAAEMDLPK